MKNMRLRSRITRIVSSINSDTWALASALNEVYLREIYLCWGFKSWADYIENEVKIGLRKAQYLVRFMEWADKLENEEMVDWLKSLGWTKARLLVGKISSDDYHNRREMIESMSCDQIRAYFQLIGGSPVGRSHAERKRIDRAVENMPQSLSGEEAVAHLRNHGVSAEAIVEEYGFTEKDVRGLLRHVHFFVTVEAHERLKRILSVGDVDEGEICRILIDLGLDCMEGYLDGKSEIDLRKLPGFDDESEKLLS